MLRQGRWDETRAVAVVSPAMVTVYCAVTGRAIGPRYPGVLSDDGLTVLVTTHRAGRWTEVVPVEELEEAPEAPKLRHRAK